MFPQRLATRLTLFFVTMLAVVLVVIVGLALILDQHSYTGSEDATLLDIAEAAAERLQSRADMSAVLDEFSTAATFLQTEDLEGRILVRSANLGPNHIPYRVHAAEVIPTDGFHSVQYQRQELRLVRHPLREDTAVTGYVIVARAVPDTNKRLVDLGGILVGTASFGLLIGVVGSVILIRREVAPIRTLTDEALAASSSGFRVPLVAEGDGSEEARELRRALSKLVDSQRQALSRERSFFADSSHVLRTPLAVLQGALEQLDAGAVGDERERALTQAHASLEAMTQSVSALLLLSRDTPPDPATWEVIEADAVLWNLVEGAAGANPALHVTSEIAGALPVAGDRYQLRALFASIIENACQYTPDGGEVTVSASRAGDDLVVEVRDSGVGFTGEDLDRAFDRFYRGKAARAMRPEGSGLGLSIARRIAELHNGSLELRSPRPSGAVVRLRLPLVE